MFANPAAQAAGWAGVGLAVAERRVGLIPVRGCDVPRDDDAAERLVAAGDALREHDHVRARPEPLDAEPVPQPAEPADHRVADQQDAVPPAHLCDGLDVTGRRRDHPARADHGLDEERSDPLRADLQ
jgi:hypothetical protein